MIEFRSVTKRYAEGPPAVDDLNMEIGTGELCVLVGPSGCGKTTTLKMINRLVEPSAGEILINDVNALEIDAVQLRRGIGYVMQQGGLFPHLRIAENVATVPRLLGWSKERVAARVEELLELVGLEPGIYLRRFPHQLSGGERQRVGVARALAADPPVLLMDEPFGAVDPITRKRLQEEFLELQARLNKTVVFVTHDINEALFLGTRIAIMHRGGVLEQYDTPSAILAKPATPFVAEFVGSDRDLQRLAVTDLSLEDLDDVPAADARTPLDRLPELARQSPFDRVVVLDREGRPTGIVGHDPALGGRDDGLIRPLGPALPLGTSLKHALATMLQLDDAYVPVTNGESYVGLLTIEGLHAAMRRSAGTPPVSPIDP